MTHLTDLQKFSLLFGLEFKQIKPGVIEYRVGDLDSRLQEARNLIANNNLALIAECKGNMASMKAFWVRSIDEV